MTNTHVVLVPEFGFDRLKAARAVHVYIHGGTEDQTLDWLLGQLR